VEARRLALAAQGFDRPRPARVTIRDLARVIRRLALVQLDYVNVLVPSHYQVPFSRLGPYDRTLLDRLVYRSGEFTEHWAHEASIVPTETWPLLRYRRDEHRPRPWGFEKFLRDNPVYVASVLDEVRSRGPLRADELPHLPGRRASSSTPGSARSPGGAGGTLRRGALAVSTRESDFARRYDLAERVVPAEHHGRAVEREEAQRQLLLQAARAHGVGTAADLADYFRMPVLAARPRLAELVASGTLREAEVEGWRETAYLHRTRGLRGSRFLKSPDYPYRVSMYFSLGLWKGGGYPSTPATQSFPKAQTKMLALTIFCASLQRPDLIELAEILRYSS